MKARFMAESPDEIVMTMKLTMSLKQWSDLRDQLESKWPAIDLSRKISDLLTQGRKVFYAKMEDEED